MLWLTLALAVLVGVTVGLLGGGGSILTVPLLAYVAGQPGKDAAAESLFVVFVTSVLALVPHARGGRVRWRTGLAFGVPSVVGAYVGGRLAHLVSDTVLLVAFGVLMLAAAVAMIRGRREEGEAHEHQLPLVRAGGLGLLIGLVTGFLGAGGGFVVVPALVLLGGLPMAAAVGTSLLVIALNSMAGFAGHLAQAHVDWPLTLAVTGASVVGVLAGARLTGRIEPSSLRTAFGWFVLVMGAFVLSKELIGF